MFNFANATTLATLLRGDGGEINVPRALTPDQCSELLSAGLIVETGVESQRPDHRYQATELAQDIIWGRIE